MENIEYWESIKKHPLYEISNYGNIKSIHFGKEKILKTRIGKSGYKTVGIYSEKKLKNFQVHQLMAIQFLNHIPCGHKNVVNHKDLNRLNNHKDNLEIVTNRENSSNKKEKNTSIYIGVSWNAKRMKWISQIQINGKNNYLGAFNEEIDAYYAYKNKLKEIG